MRAILRRTAMRVVLAPALLLVPIVFPVLAPATARADPHPLPFSYPYATLPRGLSEIEQYIDLTPVKSFDSIGANATTPRGVLITEIEYGITDRLELGFYLQFSNNPGLGTGPAPLRFDGIKQRLRYRFADAGQWPVNVGIYGEVAELNNEIELEAKVILDRRIGRWLLIANLWGEREFYYSGRREWVANPTGGATFEVTPAFSIGVEYWMRGEFGASVPAGVARFNSGIHHYVGPAFLVQGTRVWLAVAPYLRLDDWNRAGQVGDIYGRMWIRSIFGIDLQ